MDVLPSMEPAYDAFAWFYNRYWNERFHQSAFPVLQRIFLAKLPEKAKVLDLCCGTGYLARILVSRGLRITGVDASAEMVRYAKENEPQAEFHVGDIREFRFPCRFDGAVSTFDSLNHILALPDLQRVFRNVGRALRKRALFAFDMLFEAAYRARWADNYALVRNDHVLAITGEGFDAGNKLAHCRITMFRLENGAWQRSDTVVTERCYTAEEVTSALEAAGFGGVALYDARDLGMQGDLGEGRVFVTARRA
jgi:SAM-dependent methyltransferase